jgi:hypothetical protein
MILPERGVGQHFAADDAFADRAGDAPGGGRVLCFADHRLSIAKTDAHPLDLG